LAKVIFSSDLQRYTGGANVAEVVALNYRDLVVELSQRFPALTSDVIQKYAVAIDGAVIQQPLLTNFSEDSELVFVAKIVGG